MKELLDAPKTATIPGTNIVLERVPSLVVLTDGQATNAIKGQWSNPDRTDEGLVDDLTFVNGFSKKKWISFTDICYNPNKVDPKVPDSGLVYGWHRFLTTNSVNSGFDYKMMGRSVQKKTKLPNEKLFPGVKYYQLDTEQRMKDLATHFKETQEYILLSTLMTAGYMKAAIKEAYTQECKVYTVSVDMNDPGADDFATGVANGEKDIDSNAPMMNPSKYFSIDWLKSVGVIKSNADENAQTKDSDVNNKIYKTETTGSQTVLSIYDAVKHFNGWKNNGDNISLTYRTMTNNVKFDQDNDYMLEHVQDYSRPYGKNFWIAGKINDPQTIDHLVAGNPNNPYNLSDKDIDVNYADKSYYASSSNDASSSIQSVFSDIMSQVALRTFTPIGGNNDAGIGDALTYMDPIGEYMEVKNVSDVTLFGTRYGITKTAVYDYKFIEKTNGFINGWYDKNGNRLSNQNLGNWTEHTYYVDFNTASQYISTLSVNGESEKVKNTVFTIYGVSNIKAGIDPFTGGTITGEIAVNTRSNKKEEHGGMYALANPCYEDDSGINYTLNSIQLWVEDTDENTDSSVGGGIESDTGYAQALYVNIPAEALPLQVVTVKFDDNVRVESYSNNLEKYNCSTPFKVFYHVGVVEEVLDGEGQIDREKIDTEYIHKNSDENGNIFFYSNWYKTNSYSYNSAGKTYTRGDPILTFSPNADNQYYTAQTPIPLYTYDGIGDPNRKGLNVVMKDDSYQDEAEVKLELVTDHIDDNRWYYIVSSYFTSEKDIAYRASARHSTEFGYGIGGDTVKHGAYLCWYNAEEGLTSDYVNADGSLVPKPTKKTGEKGEWVVALRAGSLRTGNLSQSVGDKSGDYIKGTSETYYLPTISSSTSGITSDGVIVNVYLGNNGQIIIPSTQLVITKHVDIDDATKELLRQTGGEPRLDILEFEFELFLENRVGDFLGTVIKRSNNGVWIRQVDTVTVFTDGNGLLLSGETSGDDSTARVVKLITIGGNTYYIYVPTDNRTALEKTNTSNFAVQKFYVNAFLVPQTEVDNDESTGWTFNGGTPYEYQVYESNPDGNGGNVLSTNAWIDYKYQTKTLKFNKKNQTTFTLKDGEGLLFSGLNSGTSYAATEILKEEDGFNFVKVTDEYGEAYTRGSTNYPLSEEKRDVGMAYTVSGDTAAGKASEVNYVNTYATLLMITKQVELDADTNALMEKFNKKPNFDNEEFDFEVMLENKIGDFYAFVVKYSNENKWLQQFDTVTVVTDDNGLLLAGSVTENDNIVYASVKVQDKDYYLYIPDKNAVMDESTESKIEESTEETITNKYDPAIQSFYVEAVLIPKDDVEKAGGTKWTYNDSYKQTEKYPVYKTAADGSGNELERNAKLVATLETKKLEFKEENNTADFKLKNREGLLLDGINSGTKYTVTELLAENKGFSFKKVTDESGEQYEEENAQLTLKVDKRGESIITYTINNATTAADKVSEVHYLNYMDTGNLSIQKTVVSDDEDIVSDNMEFTFQVTLTLPNPQTMPDGGCPYYGDAFVDGVTAPNDGCLKLELVNDDDNSSEGGKTYSGTVKLKHGQRIEIVGLPAGTIYNVEEIKWPGYMQVNKINNSGTIKQDETTYAKFVNIPIRFIVPETGGMISFINPYLPIGSLLILGGIALILLSLKRKRIR